VGVGLGAEGMNLKASQDAPKRLGVSSKDLESLCAAVHVELQKAENLFNMSSSE